MELLIYLVGLFATYIIGSTLIEKKHYTSIRSREKKLLRLPAVTAKNALDQNRKVESACLVCGNAVISIDNFKKFLGGLKNIFGGEISCFETVLDRARREALLRMKESTLQADIIINMRIETSTIAKSDRGKGTGCSEVLAYGTAVTYKK